MGESPRKKLKNFYAQHYEVRYKKGEIIVRAHDDPSGIFWIKEGFVRVYSICEQGKELTLIIFKPGSIFPITWGVAGLSNIYYVEAMTPVALRRAPRAQFKKFLKENPDVLLNLINRLLMRLRGFMVRMEQMTFGDAYQKVASILTICAERFGKRKGKNVIIQVPLGHKDIANLIGLTRETTSIEMKKLQDKKIIDRNNHLLVIKNLKKLKREARLFTY